MKFLTKKQKVLLALINELSKKKMSSKLGIVKGLFVLKEEEKVDQLIKFYSFFPYKYGPYSYMSYRDINQLKLGGYITDDESQLTQKGIKAASNIDLKILNKIKRTTARFNSDLHIKNHVYKKYPYYTKKSQLIIHQNIKKHPGIYSIGYEGEDIDSFLNLLIKNEIDMLIDVRNNPFSMNFSFTKNKLKYYLENLGVKYIHLPELGIISNLRKNLRSEEDYKTLFDLYGQTILKENKEKIKNIIELSKNCSIAIMCFERNKDMCHRGVISKYIEAEGNRVTHI